jgi:hypothetical protein
MEIAVALRKIDYLVFQSKDVVLGQILQCLFVYKDPQELQFSASSNPKCPAHDKLKSPLIAKLPSVTMFWDQNFVTSSLAVLVARAAAVMSSRAVSRLWQSSLSSAISFDFIASIILQLCTKLLYSDSWL